MKDINEFSVGKHDGSTVARPHTTSTTQDSPLSPAQELKAWLAASKMSMLAFSQSMGMTVGQLNAIMDGTAAISHSTAHRLQRVTGTRWEKWTK